MTDREPQHYLSYVRENLIASWKAHAVLGERRILQRGSTRWKEWTERAEDKQSSLRDERNDKVWPWAFQLGGTPAAKSMKKNDVLWVVARLSGLGRKWPPALVARMTLAEDAWIGPPRKCDRRDLPFPYHFGVALFTRERDGVFFPANDATTALLGSLSEKGDEREPAQTAEAHLKAWNDKTHTGFASLRRIHDPGPLKTFTDRLRTHSIFLSYRWNDHAESSRARADLRDLAEMLMVKRRVGVWLDNLSLPASRIDQELRRAVIEQLLRSPLRETPLLVAHVTRDYGGPSADLAAGEPGYTLQEWRQARKVFVWENATSKHADLLREGVVPCGRCESTDPLAKVAKDIDACLDELS